MGISQDGNRRICPKTYYYNGRVNVMAKKLSEKIIKEVSEYKRLLEADDLPIVGMYVYGSHAKGTAREGSDIDVAIVSPKFKSPWLALDYLLSKLPYGKGWSIEPVGFNPADFADKYSSLINEIKTYGVEV